MTNCYNVHRSLLNSTMGMTKSYWIAQRILWVKMCRVYGVDLGGLGARCVWLVVRMRCAGVMSFDGGIAFASELLVVVSVSWVLFSRFLRWSGLTVFSRFSGSWLALRRSRADSNPRRCDSFVDVDWASILASGPTCISYSRSVLLQTPRR
jgi:hypothetical protein